MTGPAVWGKVPPPASWSDEDGVVSATTSGLVTTPPKSLWMKVSISSSRPRRSVSSIICVPE